jgi:hypothetical protein
MENLHGVGVLFFPTRHLFFPQERFFGVLGFLRRLTHEKDYSFFLLFYFYYYYTTFGGNSDDFEARQRGQQETHRDTDETYRLPQTIMPTQN